MIVFDSSTLILVAKVDLLDLIVARSPVQLAIPEEVERECCLETRTLDALLIRKRIDEAKIRTIAVKRKRVAKELAADFSLGSGEAAAIALAMEQRAQLVAIDDKNGINACKLVKLAFTTAIAMLVEGAAKGWLDREQALARLEILASHARYKQSILEDARRRLGVLK